jgi:hypothetical protein
MKQEVSVRKGQLRKSKSGAAYPARGDISYLKCHNAINGVTDEETGNRRCFNTAPVRYESIEQSILNIALHFAASRTAQTHGEVEKATIELANADRGVEEAKRQLDTLVDSFSRTGSASLERAILIREAELDNLQERRASLAVAVQDAIARNPPPDHMASVRALRAELNSDDLKVRNFARVRMKQLLRQLVSRMECGSAKETLVVLGEETVGVLLDSRGNIVGNCILQQRVFGPEGEPDWNPAGELQTMSA